MRAFLEFVLFDGLLLVALFYGVTFLVALGQQMSSGARITERLQTAPLGVGNLYAAIGGAITPFCSCSTVPVVGSMLRAKIRFGFCMTFLMASPMVNEAALIVMLRYTSPLNVALFLALTMCIPILFGMLLDRLRFERFLKAVEGGARIEGRVDAPDLEIPFRAKARFARTLAHRELVGSLPYLGIGLVIGGLIHGFVPSEWILGIAEGLSPPVLVLVMALVGIPLYFNMAAAVPIAFALADKGLGLGPMIAFLVAGAGTSLPEMVLLLRLFRKELLAAHVVSMFAAAVIIGMVFLEVPVR